MTNPPNPLIKMIATPDPADVALLDKIMEKTKAGKLFWNRLRNGFVAQLPDAMKIEFVNSGFGAGWSTFTVKTKEGTVLHVENRGNLVFAVLAGSDPDPLSAKVSILYSEVQKVGEGAVERAIKILDRI